MRPPRRTPLVLLVASVAGCSACAPSVREAPPADDTASDSAPPPDEPGPDGPCATYGAPEEVARVKDGALREISGLAVSSAREGLLWAIEDSGAKPRIVALDDSGATLGRVEVEGATNVDWEDLALGPCPAGTCLHVGDFGDNGASRDDLAIYRLPEPSVPEEPGWEQTATAERLPFAYPEGPRDAEALVVTPDGVPAVLTKRKDATSEIYRLEGLAPGEVATARLIATIPTGKAKDLSTSVTAADLWPDGSRLLVRTYFSVLELAVPGGDLAALAGATPKTLPAALEPQGEAIAYDPARRGFWQVSEGENPILWFVGCAE